MPTIFEPLTTTAALVSRAPLPSRTRAALIVIVSCATAAPGSDKNRAARAVVTLMVHSSARDRQRSVATRRCGRRRAQLPRQCFDLGHRARRPMNGIAQASRLIARDVPPLRFHRLAHPRQRLGGVA